MNQVTFKGNPLTLQGNPVQVGDTFREFTLVANDLSEFSFQETQGVRIFLAVPSLDTGLCDLEVKRFNEEATSIEGVSVYAISMDLPFAQSRWCGNAGVKHVKTLSDHKYRSFGEATGTYIKELGLLTRASFVVDSAGKVTFVEYLEEVASEPTYSKIIEAAKAAR